MKTTEKLKEEIYKEVQNSGFFKNMQAQVKSHVLEVIEKESNAHRDRLGFQYEHPLLSKMRKFPLTSLCMDLIQEFLESFKFKHTLNVFKKEINRNLNINRTSLAQEFQIQINNPESQAVLLSLVSQLVSGNINLSKNNFKGQTKPARVNNFIGENTQTKVQKNQLPSKANDTKSIVAPISIPVVLDDSSSISKSVVSDSKLNSSKSNDQNIQPNKSIEKVVEPSVEEKKVEIDDKIDKKKRKKDQQKPKEAAEDLLLGVVGKFSTTIKVDKEKERTQLFQSKRAFSEEKEKKVLDPSESGTNKIRGISAGKSNSFLSKFLPPAPPKNESVVEEELDEFQQSKDSTRKNPLYSSGESGFDKSGFDQSVDSNAIEGYEYVEKARKFGKK